MKGLIPLVGLPMLLTACTPPTDMAPNLAASACERADVQDVVSKEVRNMALKANSDGVLAAAFLGFDLGKAFEEARVSFSEVGVDTGTTSNSGPPFTQIVCGGTMQIDFSSARTGQDIVTLPRLRWSIDFVQPTNDPATAGFTIAVDPANVWQDMLINGKPVESAEANPAKPEPAPVAPQPQAEGAAAETQDIAAEAAAADAAAAEAERAASEHQPSDEDLYAPHPN